jgi:hypothetical protein
MVDPSLPIGKNQRVPRFRRGNARRRRRRRRRELAN